MTDRPKPRDAVSELVHDHTHLGRLVDELYALLSHPGPEPGSARENVQSAVDALEEDLIAHFSREEEGLFPYLERELPHERDTLAALTMGHDAVCGTLSRLARAMARALETGADSPAALEARALTTRFLNAYRQHAEQELAFLRRIATNLSPEQMRHVAELVVGL